MCAPCDSANHMKLHANHLNQINSMTNPKAVCGMEKTSSHCIYFVLKNRKFSTTFLELSSKLELNDVVSLILLFTRSEMNHTFCVFVVEIIY